MSNATWLEEMPVLPLARGVPVRQGDRKGLVVLVIRGNLAPGGEGCEVAWDDGEHITAGGLVDSVDLRVDLDDPQGFGYALRCYAQRREGSGPSPLTWMPRYLNSQTTDDDRLALARACAEVTRG